MTTFWYASCHVSCVCAFKKKKFKPTFPVLELMFLETSALTGENVEEGFLKCARTILNKIESGKQTLFWKNIWIEILYWGYSLSIL